jgi:hypothetical protein
MEKDIDCEYLEEEDSLQDLRKLFTAKLVSKRYYLTWQMVSFPFTIFGHTHTILIVIHTQHILANHKGYV